MFIELLHLYLFTKQLWTLATKKSICDPERDILLYLIIYWYIECRSTCGVPIAAIRLCSGYERPRVLPDGQRAGTAGGSWEWDSAAVQPPEGGPHCEVLPRMQASQARTQLKLIVSHQHRDIHFIIQYKPAQTGDLLEDHNAVIIIQFMKEFIDCQSRSQGFVIII